MSSLGGYAVRRTALAIPVLLGASVVVFLAVFALPGDPVTALGGQRSLPSATRQAIERKYHLDEALPSQYVHYITGAIHGDLGESFATRRPVRTIIAEALPNTAKLAATAVAIELVLGVAIGVFAATTRHRSLDKLVLVLGGLAIAVPIYVLATTLQYFLGLEWGILPISGTEDGARSWILPAIALAIPSLAFVTRLTRAGIRDALGEGYIELAVAKGAGRRRVITHHALKNTLVPVITFVGVDFALLLGGALFVESIFNIPGLGSVTTRAIAQRDNTVVLGVTLLLITSFIVLNLAADLVAALIDPRIRDA